MLEKISQESKCGTEMSMQDKIEELKRLKARALLGGGEAKIASQHEKQRLTARERIDRLLDGGSFVEMNMLVGNRTGTPADGIITGHGTIDGRAVCVYAQDATVLGGSTGGLHGMKMYSTIEMALNLRVPLIGLCDSPGYRFPKITEGALRDEQAAIDFVRQYEPIGAPAVFFPNTEASGIIPQIAGIMGPCAGISVYSPALMDFIFMIDKTSYMFITGPRVVKTATSQDVTPEELGGARVHAQISGVADFRMKSEDDCFSQIKRLLTFLPSNNQEPALVIDTDDDPERMVDSIVSVVPDDSRKGYDMHKVIKLIVDNGDFLEVKAEFAREMIVGFARLEGHTVGIVANQPQYLSGCITIDSSDKQARFMRFCDAFNIPLLLLTDTSAYLPGKEQEHSGIIRHGAKVLYALCEAVVPRVTLILRKSYGGGQMAMGVMPGGIGSDLVLAWPTAEHGALGAEQAVDLFYGAEIAKAENPQQVREQLIKDYRQRYANPFFTSSIDTHIHDVIEPRETRRQLIRAFRLLRTKKVNRHSKRHGNIPL